MLKLEKRHSDKETDSNGNYEVSTIVNMSALRLLSWVKSQADWYLASRRSLSASLDRVHL